MVLQPIGFGANLSFFGVSMYQAAIGWPTALVTSGVQSMKQVCFRLS